MRIEGIRALGSIREWDATLPHFETLLQKGDPDLIEEICWALEKADDALDSILPRVLPVFKKYPEALDAALLTQCNPEITGPFLIKHVQSESRDLSLLCLKALSECDVAIPPSTKSPATLG